MFFECSHILYTMVIEKVGGISFAFPHILIFCDLFSRCYEGHSCAERFLESYLVFAHLACIVFFHQKLFLR